MFIYNKTISRKNNESLIKIISNNYPMSRPDNKLNHARSFFMHCMENILNFNGTSLRRNFKNGSLFFYETLCNDAYDLHRKNYIDND